RARRERGGRGRLLPGRPVRGETRRRSGERVSRGGPVLLEQRHVRVPRRSLSGGAGKVLSGHPRSGGTILGGAYAGSRFLPAGRTGVPGLPRGVDRLCGDGEDGGCGRGGGRHRLERYRFLVLAVAG